MPLISKKIHVNQEFIGRESERDRLLDIVSMKKSSVIILYGRRRVGKTELLEQTFRKYNILKFEGLENQLQVQQMAHVMDDLADYAQERLLRDVQVRSWKNVFKQISAYTEQGQWIIYFEEVQWLADYQDNFISELKYAWDNYFRYNDQLTVILCGSAPSFMLQNVVRSKALYNRSQHVFSLKELSLNDVSKFLRKYSKKDIMDAYLTVGGIPVYLERVSEDSSVFLSLCKNSFRAEAFFTEEYERIFISSLSENDNFRKIIDFLAQRRYATRQEILQHLGIKSGGRVTALFQDLEMCGFIGHYVPYNVAENSMLSRYCITDAYLQFYFKFIKPVKKDIKQGKYNQSPTTAINMQDYRQWLGYSFERFCRMHHPIIAEMLGFSAVKYRAGPFYNRETVKKVPGFQIDLLFDRDDHVITICEIKYNNEPVGSKVVSEFEKKMAYFPNAKNKTIHKVLIAVNGAAESVVNQCYFDRIITLDDFFKS